MKTCRRVLVSFACLWPLLVSAWTDASAETGLMRVGGFFVKQHLIGYEGSFSRLFSPLDARDDIELIDVPNPCLGQEKCRVTRSKAIQVLHDSKLHILMVLVPADQPPAATASERTLREVYGRYADTIVFYAASIDEDCSAQIETRRLNAALGRSRLTHRLNQTFTETMEAVAARPECHFERQ